MHCTSRSIFAIICIRLLHQYGFPCTKCTTSIPIWCVYVRVFLSMCWRCPKTLISSELYVLQHFVLLSFININIASCIHHYSLILYQLHVCSLYSWNTCLHKRSITTISSPSNPCHCLSICFGSVCVSIHRMNVTAVFENFSIHLWKIAYTLDPTNGTAIHHTNCSALLTKRQRIPIDTNYPESKMKIKDGRKTFSISCISFDYNSSTMSLICVGLCSSSFSSSSFSPKFGHMRCTLSGLSSFPSNDNCSSERFCSA